jgi:cellulose synthase (UDP-forming)
MLIFLLPFLLLASTMVLTRWVPSHPRWRPIVVALNLAATVRYLWWRGTETLNWDGGWGTAMSLAIFAAELYGFVVLLQHYSVATVSLDRTTAPPDEAFCPSVDIFVASYNEGEDIVTRTLVGCQAIDYPNKQVYLLDDGRRPEMAALCRTLGVHYITRDNNHGAKAGNLNHALARTTGEFIVTFDADHVPVSSFLTETLGHFRDAGVAQLQTPQHFFNPDLFQDRLRSQAYIANEQDMFFHILQPGRDVYNASFYCGSGAILRRSAIEAIGGLPMTTITEDVHTSMLLHSRGWRSVYVNKDLSAGLAPESFDAYVVQRRRWSRGMMQVMLLRGGLWLPGLTLAQRIHYMATLWYWLYGIPRIVFLLAPLSFLLFGVRPLIVRSVWDLLSYYLPHLFISAAAFSVVTRGTRRVFWSDIYEACIAVQLAMTALTFPWTGTRVHFAVTPKGQSAERPRAKRGVWQGWPMTVLVVLLVVGLIKGAISASAGGELDAILVNASWSLYNLVVLSFGLLLLRQPAQRRVAPRLARRHACRLAWPGMTVGATSIDLSESGASLRLDQPMPLPQTFDLTITSREGRTVTARGRLVRSELRDGEVIAAVRIVDRTLEQHRRLIELMFSAPDSWLVEEAPPMAAPQHLGRVVRSLVQVFARRRALQRLAPRFEVDLAVVVSHADGRDVKGRVMDVSHAGMGVSLSRDEALPEGTTATVTVSWNQYEQTTFQVHVVNARVERGYSVLGLAFVDLDGLQNKDLMKHLYPDAAQVERKAA